MYDDTSTLAAEIAAGEDTYLELKELVFRGDQIRFAGEGGRAPKVIAEVFVSLANTEGGVIVFGVRNDGTPVGIDPARKELVEQFIVNLSQDLCVPPIDPLLDWRRLPNAEGQPCLCLKVDVPKARFVVHQTKDGRFLRRVGSHRQPILPEALGRMLTARGLVLPFEERPVVAAPFGALDRVRFERYYESRFSKPMARSSIPYEQLVENLKLATRLDDGRLVPTNLGLLLFCDAPARFIPGAFVDLAVYDHEEADGNTRDTRRFDGLLPSVVEQLLRYFRASPLLATTSTKTGVGRIDRPAYALLALQESLVNALIHRDYDITGSQVIVTVHPSRIVVKSPGALPNTLTPDDLYAGCLPIRRNQLLAGMLRDMESPTTGAHLVESRGEGFLNLVRESERLSGRRPDLVVRAGSVWLTLYAAHDGSGD